MANQNVIVKVSKILEPIIEVLNFELYDVEFIKEGPHWYLRIYIDKEGGITLDDCELLSRRVEKILDENDFINQAYMLEVSSPGINRQLKKQEDFIRYMGNIVDIKLYKPNNNKKEYEGVLKEYKNGDITIEDEKGNIFAFSKEEVASVRLSFTM